MPFALRSNAFPVALAALVVGAVSVAASEPPLRNLTWSGEVPAGASLWVENTQGDVRLRAGGEDRRVEVSAVLQGGMAPGAVPSLGTQLRDGRLELVVAPPKEAAAGAPCRADLVVFVPKGVPVEVHTARGLIEAKGLKGDATLGSDRGDIVAKGVRGALCARSERGAVTAELETAPGVQQSLSTLTGDVTAYLWEDASVTVEAATSGELSTDFSLQVEYRKSEEPSKRAVAVVGGGGARLSLSSKQGRVRILRLPRGFQKEGRDEAEPKVPVHP